MFLRECWRLLLMSLLKWLINSWAFINSDFDLWKLLHCSIVQFTISQDRKISNFSSNYIVIWGWLVELEPSIWANCIKLNRAWVHAWTNKNRLIFTFQQLVLGTLYVFKEGTIEITSCHIFSHYYEVVIFDKGVTLLRYLYVWEEMSNIEVY